MRTVSVVGRQLQLLTGMVNVALGNLMHVATATALASLLMCVFQKFCVL